MIRWLGTVRSVRTGNLLLLVFATAVLSHVASTLPWKRLMGDHSSLWSDFCEKLKRAGDSVDFYSPNDDELDRAEGYRFLTRMLRLGLQAELEYRDAARPVIWESETPTQKFGANNPDELYHEATIDGNRTYRVYGQRGTTPLIEFTVYDGRIGSDAGSAPAGHLTEAELVVEKDGRFELVLSPDPHPGNWIQTKADSKLLFIRQYRIDWERDRPAQLQIEQVGEAPTPPVPLGMAELKRKLDRSADFVLGNAALWGRYTALSLLATKNDFIEPFVDGNSPLGNVQLPLGHAVQSGAFEIDEDEALVIRFTPPPELPYWGFSLANRWYESLDYRYSTVHSNHGRAQPESDGTVELVVAHRDPGTPNWISTTGHRRGIMLFRWARPDPATRYPDLDVQLVKLSSL